MKIDNNDSILKSLYPESNHKGRSSEGKEFSAVLKETFENTQKTDSKIQQTTSFHPLSSVRPVSSVHFHKQYMVGRIENLIGLLDQYRIKLADSRNTLKTIDPIIQKVKQEKENMTPVLNSLNDDDELKNILKQALITASLEIAKFNRGDYIPA